MDLICFTMLKIQYPVVSEGYTIQDVPNILQKEYCDLQSLKMLFT